MAVHFFDSSSLAKRYVSEKGSTWVLGLVGPSSGHQSHIARITGAEVVAAITRRGRAGSLSTADVSRMLTAFRHDFQHESHIVEITPALVQAAMTLAEAHAIRGYDAVQLAAALELNAASLAMGIAVPLVSADTALNAAAAAEGLAVDDPNAH